MISRTSEKQLWRGFRPSPSVGRTSTSHPRLSAISRIYLGSRQGKGLTMSSFFSWLSQEALSKWLNVLQYSSCQKLPKRAFHLQEPLEESSVKATTLRSMNLSGLKSTSSSALHHPDYLSKYSFMMSSSRQNTQQSSPVYSRYLRAYSHRRLRLRGLFLSLHIPRTFFFLKPQIFSKRSTTDLSMRAFITGSIPRSTSAIYTCVRNGFSVRTWLSMAILPSVLDFETGSSEVLVSGKSSLGFSGFLRILGSYFHYLRRVLIYTFIYYCASTLQAFKFYNSMYYLFSFYICARIISILRLLDFLSRLFAFCYVFYSSTYYFSCSISDA